MTTNGEGDMEGDSQAPNGITNTTHKQTTGSDRTVMLFNGHLVTLDYERMRASTKAGGERGISSTAWGVGESVSVGRWRSGEN